MQGQLQDRLMEVSELDDEIAGVHSQLEAQLLQKLDEQVSPAPGRRSRHAMAPALPVEGQASTPKFDKRAAAQHNVPPPAWWQAGTLTINMQ